MLTYIKNLIKTGVVTLRFSLLSIFITLFVAAMLTLFSVFYFHLSDLVVRAAYLLVDKDTYAIINDLNIHLYPIEGASKFTAELIEDGIIDVKNPRELQSYMNHLLQKMPLVNGMHWSDMQGNYIYSRKETNGSITSQVIDRRGKTPSEIYLYRDKAGNIVKQESVKLNFDPRVRPWFQLALKTKATTWSDVYAYSIGPAHLGVTIVTPVMQHDHAPRGVFGMDIRLDYLSRYVATHKIGKTGEVFIVDEHGKLIASPQLSSIDPTRYYRNGLIDLSAVSKPYADAFAAFRQRKQSMFIFEEKNEDYIASFKKIPSLVKHGWYVGVVDPENDFTRPIRELQFLYLFIDSLVFVLGILLISNLVTRIVTPIKKLVRETERIKNFNLDHGERILSRIKEVLDLRDALDSMKTGLRSFQKYVPASLVRQLIKLGEDVRIGGSKRKLAIFFSDIEGFTAITEKTESNQLVQQVCDYFDVLTHIITNANGTIDKYIGDSIMAFWGAPVVVDAPCQQAANAALRCQQQVKLLNTDWVDVGMAALPTRFGIHYGEALVGNLGSSERLNYTALGDAVNIASRLVNANKLYGTSILVTEPVYEQVGADFQLRLVDHVVFKGKAESIAIYELIGKAGQRILFDLDAYRAEFAKAFSAYQARQWQQAIAHFDTCKRIYPQDTVALIFIERCQQLHSNPPPTTWDGIWRLSEK